MIIINIYAWQSDRWIYGMYILNILELVSNCMHDGHMTVCILYILTGHIGIIMQCYKIIYI